ncbi:MAG: hypothetical protein Q8O89_07315, partial [Nanoarchaeota archaeon]|nr:hypothetical protein [Nanoarchaeota archaeon]
FRIDKKQFLTFVRSKIMTLERIAFLKKYEESCHYLGIKEPIMTLARYNQFKLQAYKNFQKRKAAEGFK